MFLNALFLRAQTVLLPNDQALYQSLASPLLQRSRLLGYQCAISSGMASPMSHRWEAAFSWQRIKHAAGDMYSIDPGFCLSSMAKWTVMSRLVRSTFSSRFSFRIQPSKSIRNSLMPRWKYSREFLS